jgi:hypothetical protein
MPEVGIVIDWGLGAIAAFLLLWPILRIIDGFEIKNQQRVLETISILNGLMIPLGISPFGKFSNKLSEMSMVVPPEYPELIEAILTIETVLLLIFGLLIVIESGGSLGASSFILGFIGGMTLLVNPIIGTTTIALAYLLMEAAPSRGI